MNSSFHRSEQDFRATVARGALRARPVVKMARQMRAPRWLVLGLAIVDVLSICVALVAGGAL